MTHDRLQECLFLKVALLLGELDLELFEHRGERVFSKFMTASKIL
jgi:hypothetical protein